MTLTQNISNWSPPIIVTIKFLIYHPNYKKPKITLISNYIILDIIKLIKGDDVEYNLGSLNKLMKQYCSHIRKIYYKIFT